MEQPSPSGVHSCGPSSGRSGSSGSSSMSLSSNSPCVPTAAVAAAAADDASLRPALGWGSFKSPPVDELIAQSDESYTAPPIPIGADVCGLIEQLLASPPRASSPPPSSLPSQSAVARVLARSPLPPSLSSSPLLRASVRFALFQLSGSFTFINHGAFGCALSALSVVQREWQRRLEAQPLRFIDRELLPLLVLTTRRLARFLHCQPQQLALLPNASTALTSVVRGIAARPELWGVVRGRSVLRLSLAYGAVKRQIDWLGAETGAEVVEIEVRLPVRRLHDTVVRLVDDALTQSAARGRPVAVAFLDHISSNTAVQLPLRRLLQLCRSRSVLAVVDGAHGPWQTRLRLSELGADVTYVGNLHKWMCNPKGAAFLYCGSAQLALSMQPPAISHGHGRSFTSNFLWSGTADYAALLTAMDACTVWERGWRTEDGAQLSWEHCRAFAIALCKWARRMLVTAWGTALLWEDDDDDEERHEEGVGQRADEDAEALCMVCVAVGWGDSVAGATERLQDALYALGIECPCKMVDGRLHVRISAHIYNRPEDYVHLAEAVLQLRQHWTLSDTAGPAIIDGERSQYIAYRYGNCALSADVSEYCEQCYFLRRFFVLPSSLLLLLLLLLPLSLAGGGAGRGGGAAAAASLSSACFARFFFFRPRTPSLHLRTFSSTSRRMRSAPAPASSSAPLRLRSMTTARKRWMPPPPSITGVSSRSQWKHIEVTGKRRRRWPDSRDTAGGDTAEGTKAAAEDDDDDEGDDDGDAALPPPPPPPLAAAALVGSAGCC